MQLSSFSDFALRTLVFLAVADDEPVPVRLIAERHGISFDHLAKVAQFLVREGFAAASRGRGGGLRLARPAAEISLGDVLRRSESDDGPVECLRGKTPVTCVLAPVCGLTPLLAEAREAFFASLDGHTLAEALPRHAPVRRVLGMAPT
ncbi:MAG: transcriptional regulator [Alphaproteobacteria bacterium HGW-Alphaproteobacteria-1]|jgi:Rrf2 family nitric oxide-sensitive transcriptional repressor|nr:MAG: transcriptional regulator [Alphaproteobacteria bacterium HGW-Alphaproteobacteria-1]